MRILHPETSRAGISNIVEKSLGAIRKAGSTPLQGVFNYAERINRSGFVIMDSPGFDTPSVSGLVSSGANVVCFTTGRGTPTGNPIVPVLKIATNSRMFQHLEENMDINAGTIIDGTQSLDEVGRHIFETIPGRSLRQARQERDHRTPRVRPLACRSDVVNEPAVTPKRFPDELLSSECSAAWREMRASLNGGRRPSPTHHLPSVAPFSCEDRFGLQPPSGSA